MIKKAYKPWKPDRAGKNYRPKEDEGHTFFFKGYYINVSPDFKSVKVAEVRHFFYLPNSTLDESLVKGMEEVYKFRDKDYEEELQRIAEEEKEKEIRKNFAPYLNAIIKEIMDKQTT